MEANNMKKTKQEALAELKEFFQKNIHQFINDEIEINKRLAEIYSGLLLSRPKITDAEFYTLVFNTKLLLDNSLSRRQVNKIIKDISIPYWHSALIINLSLFERRTLTGPIRNLESVFKETSLDYSIEAILSACHEEITDKEVMNIYHQVLLNNLSELKRLAISLSTSNEASQAPHSSINEEEAIAQLLSLIEEIENTQQKNLIDQFNEKLNIMNKIKGYNNLYEKKTFWFFRESAKKIFLEQIISLVNSYTSSAYQRQVLFEYAATLPLSIAGKMKSETETAKAFRTLAKQCTDIENQPPVTYRGKTLSH